MLSIDTEPVYGRYEALLGYVRLEQAQAIVDLARHCLAKIDRLDLKWFPIGFPSRARRQLTATGGPRRRPEVPLLHEVARGAATFLALFTANQ